MLVPVRQKTILSSLCHAPSSANFGSVHGNCSSSNSASARQPHLLNLCVEVGNSDSLCGPHLKIAPNCRILESAREYMEVEGTVQGHIEESQVEKEPLKKCRVDAPSPSANGCFNCNICLDFVSEPVVTLCGHLYCWPCIYKWLQLQTASHQQCPVCKAPLSEGTLVPLYGHGPSNKEESDQSLKIPHRPSIYQDHALIASVIEHQSSHAHEEEQFDIHPPIPQPQLPHHHRHQQYYPYSFGFMSAPSPLLAAPVFHSTAGGVLGELAVAVFPGVFRNHEAGLYYRSRQYDLTASMNSPRWRRQQMLVESSLHQLWLFLFCSAVLCLLLF